MVKLLVASINAAFAIWLQIPQGIVYMWLNRSALFFPLDCDPPRPPRCSLLSKCVMNLKGPEYSLNKAEGGPTGKMVVKVSLRQSANN